MPTPSPWMLRPPDPDAASYLFCLPYSGVGASMYSRWPRRIGPAQVCPVQLPGRENRIGEPHYGTYEDLAAALAGALRQWLDRPFAFFGHCSSALAGFATALHLHRTGGPAPARLFVSSQVAPHEGPHGRFLDMDDAQLTGELLGLIGAVGGTPSPSFVELGLDVLRADLAANRAYRLAEPVRLPCAVTVVGWSDDDEVPVGLLGGWRGYGDPVRQVTLRGGHHSFLTAPLALVQELAADLKESTHVHSG